MMKRSRMFSLWELNDVYVCNVDCVLDKTWRAGVVEYSRIGLVRCLGQAISRRFADKWTTMYVMSSLFCVDPFWCGNQQWPVRLGELGHTHRNSAAQGTGRKCPKVDLIIAPGRLCGDQISNTRPLNTGSCMILCVAFDFGLLLDPLLPLVTD